MGKVVRVCVKVLEGADDSQLEADAAEANAIFRQCDVQVKIAFVETNRRPKLVDLTRNDCDGPATHTVTDEEAELFELLRGKCPSEVVAYYIRSDGNLVLGCGAHPDGRPGFTVTNNQPDRLTFAHELGHVLGLDHVPDAQNIMNELNPGTLLNETQGDIIKNSYLLSDG